MEKAMLSLLYRRHGNLLRRNQMAFCVKLQSVTNLQLFRA